MQIVRVLLVAPEGAPAGAAWGVEEIVSMEGLRVALVRSPAVMRTIESRISEAGRQRWPLFDVVAFLAHGTPTHLALDGEALDAASLLMLVEWTGCEVVVLESCSSVGLANEVAKRTKADCLATIVEQPVRRGREVIVGFLRALTAGGRPEAAFLRTAVFDANSIYLRTLRE